MKVFNNPTNNLKLIHLLVYIIVGVLVISKGAIYLPDSYTFVDMAFNHSPFYCIFLKIITGVFGDYFEIPLVVIQYTIIILGISYFLKTLDGIFKIHKTGLIVIQLICIAPCVYVHDLGSAILTEALTYPMVLITFSLTLKTLVEENFKYLFRLSILLFVLILTRGQFLAFLPVLILIVAYIIYRNKSIKKHYYFLVLLCVIPILTSFSERVYNKIVFGHFVNNSMNYVHLAASPFYIAQEEDVNLFSDKDERAYFNIVYNSLKVAKLTRNQNLDLKIGDYKFYEHNFPKICNRRVYDLGLNYFESDNLNFVERNIALNKMCSNMVIPLVKQNFKVWLYLFVKNLINSFGSSKQILFFFVLLCYGITNLIKSNGNIYKFIVVAVLFMFANNTLIALVVHSINRYVFYFDWVIFVTLIILFNEIFKHRDIRES